ncbi:MAG TPA: glycosyltransferase family 39 protein [Methylomirabilota bacterium]|nr:glycosyltransferase family 39 protein [Methylomirabilota bacterium]
MSALALFALPIGRRPLAHQDEARFALLAREAVEHHQWLLPRVRGVIYLNKPPLYFWTVALLAKPFGVVNEATAPLASLVSALTTLLAVVALGRRLWDARVGLTAALVLATAPFFYFMSHQVFSDMMMTAWLTWALYFLLTARLAPAPGPRLIGFYLCVAGALATKGPVALLALVAALAVVLAEDGWRRGLRWLRLPLGVGILALASLPWLLPYLLQSERSYLGGVVVGHYGDWYFREKSGSRLEELMENLGRFLPWTVFLAAAAWWWWRDPSPRRRPVLVWTVVIAVAVSLSGEQRARYFLPVLPPLALLIGELLVRAPVEAARRGRAVLLASLAAIALLTVGAALVLLRAPAGDAIFLPPPGWPRWAIAALAVAGPAAALGLLAARGSAAAATLALALALGGILSVEGWIYPGRDAARTNIRGFTAAVAERLPPEPRIVTHHDAGLAFDFHLRRPLHELPRLADLDALLAAPGPGDVVLMREERWEKMREANQARWQVVLADRVQRGRMVLLVPRR